VLTFYKQASSELDFLNRLTGLSKGSL
jgi:hypothetical protein